MQRRRIGLAVAAVAVVGAGIGGGTALAAGSDGSDGSGDVDGGYGARGFGGGYGPEGGPLGEHTPVTGEEVSEVTDAVEAELPDVTVQSILVDADGSYDVLATREGEPVFVEVSADLASVTEVERPAGPPHGAGPGGPGGPLGEHTEVTGDELADLTAAVEAALPGVTVEGAHSHDDGGYHVLGTRDGEPVLVEVSADLASVTEVERPAGPPHGAGPGGPRGPGGPLDGSGPGGHGGPSGEGGPDTPDTPDTPDAPPATAPSEAPTPS